MNAFNVEWFFDINSIFFTVFNYPLSYLEFWATVTGGVAVWLSAKENVWSWIIGLVNVVLAFIMFYQINLYPDMFLQIFFFITNIMGFINWKYPKEQYANNKNELKITRLNAKSIILLSSLGIAFTILFGIFSSNLNLLFPKIFSQPSAFPFIDSFTTIMSIIATFLLIYKKVEAWWIWLLVDIISTVIYYLKDAKLYSLLYAIFVIIAAFGAFSWTKSYNNQSNHNNI